MQPRWVAGRRNALSDPWPGCGGGEPPFGCREAEGHRQPIGRGGEGGALSVAAAVARPSQGRRDASPVTTGNAGSDRAMGRPAFRIEAPLNTATSQPSGISLRPVRRGRGTGAIRDWRGSLGAPPYTTTRHLGNTHRASPPVSEKGILTMQPHDIHEFSAPPRRCATSPERTRTAPRARPGEAHRGHQRQNEPARPQRTEWPANPQPLGD